jgi:hypothetical protein
MDLQALQSCSLVEDLEEKGANVEFKTYLYSLETFQVEPVVVSCPVSGNYLLTELAKIVVGKFDKKNEKDILIGLFHTIDDDVKRQLRLKNSPQQNSGNNGQIVRAIIQHLQSTDEEKSNQNKEKIKFDFLRICSEEFDQIFSSFMTDNGN